MLLGRRRLDMVFMPGRYVFPGGRVDPSDRQVAVEHDLAPGNLENLMVAMKGNRSPARARALALAAVRETFEEAGILIGAPAGSAAPPKAQAWQRFFAHGFRPALTPAHVLRPRRHAARPAAPLSTRASSASPAEAIVHRVASPTASCPTSNGTRSSRRARWTCRISRASCWRTWASASPPARCNKSDVPCPFYHGRNGNFHRDLIGRDTQLD